MKKKALLLIPFLVLGLSGCNNADEEDAPVYDSGSVPADPIQPSGNGGNEDHTTQDDPTVTIVSIDSVKESPANIDPDEGLENSSVTLRVNLSNGHTIEKHPDSITFDATGKVVGDTIECTAHLGTFSITFNSVMYVMPKDVLTATAVGGTGSYSKWTYDSPTFDAKYAGITKGTDSFTIGKDIVTQGFPGIVSTHSGGRIKKVKIVWDTESTTSADHALNIFGRTTPFVEANDLQALQKKDASVSNIKKSETPFVYTFSSEENYYYLGFKATGGGCTLFSITIYWDSTITAPTLESMRYTDDSTVSSETGAAAWDFSNVTVMGTYSDETEVDITQLVDFSSDTVIPSVVTAEMDVSVTASYKRYTKVHTANVKGSVAQGMNTAASFVYGGSTTGGTLTENMDNKSEGYYQENSSAENFYLQIESDTAYWTTNPTKIVFLATIAYGNTTEFSLGDKPVYVTLLDSAGAAIEGTQKVVTDKVYNKTGTEFTVEYVDADIVNNVYGFKITHEKISGKNLRYFSAALRYIA